MKMTKKMATLLLAFFTLQVSAQQIAGRIVDKETKEPLIGASIEIANSPKKAIANMEGEFSIFGLEEKPYTLLIKTSATNPKWWTRSWQRNHPKEKW